jgi:hypothetical protein
LPGADATEEERNDATLAAVQAIAGRLDAVEDIAASEPREAIKRLWALQHWLESFPAKWIRNFSQRHEWNSANKRIDNAKVTAFRELDEGVGKATWDCLDYVSKALPLLYKRFKVRGDVMRLILTPLGKLEHSEIRYQRDDADDLPRVCTEIREEIRNTSELDDEIARWGEANFGSLIKPGSPPRQAAPGMVDSMAPGLVGLLVGAGLAGAGGARLAGKGLETLAENAAMGMAGAGGVVLALGLFRVFKVISQKSAVPKAWASLAQKFRERLYLICSLRVLDKVASRYNHSSREFDEFLGENGGKNRWKQVKFEERDLTQVFVDEAADWHPKETVEHWLAEAVKKAFRMDSSKLTDLDEIDPEAWDVILRAYLLETRADDVNAELLDTVAELIFARHGEDTSAERERVFDEVYKAWDTGRR